VSFSNGHTCRIDRICTIHIKLFDQLVRDLKDVSYVPPLMKFISVRVLEAQGLRETLEKGILKMFNGLLVVLKGIRRNNLYYLKGNAIIENLTSSEYLENDSIRL